MLLLSRGSFYLLCPHWGRFGYTVCGQGTKHVGRFGVFLFSQGPLGAASLEAPSVHTGAEAGRGPLWRGQSVLPLEIRARETCVILPSFTVPTPGSRHAGFREGGVSVCALRCIQLVGVCLHDHICQAVSCLAIKVSGYVSVSRTR